MAKPDIIVTVDFNDEVIWRQRAVTEDDIATMLARLKGCGIDGVVWRLTCLGQAAFRSRILQAPFYDTEAQRFWVDWAGRQNGYSAANLSDLANPRRREWTEWFKGTLALIDPPEIAGRVCRELGLTFILWIDLFDGWFPGYYDPILRENPRLCWTDRSGTKFLRGVASYAFSENVGRTIRLVEEINAYRPDGLYFSLSCHALHIPEHADVLTTGGFGFERPVMERFIQRQGHEPGNGSDDRLKMDIIRGEYMTDLFRKTRAALFPGADLILPLQLHPAVVNTSPYVDGPMALSYFQDYAVWLKERIAQGLVLGDYEHIFQWTANWKIKGLKAGDDRSIPADHLEELMPGLQWEQCPHYFFSGWMNEANEIAERLSRMTEYHRRYPASGGWIHEAMNIETADAWEGLRRYVGEIKKTRD